MSKTCWFIACGPFRPSTHKALSRKLTRLVKERQEQGFELAANFTPYGLSSLWKGVPGFEFTARDSVMWQLMRPGDAAVILCDASRSYHRERMDRYAQTVRELGGEVSYCLVP